MGSEHQRARGMNPELRPLRAETMGHVQAASAGDRNVETQALLVEAETRSLGPVAATATKRHSHASSQAFPDLMGYMHATRSGWRACVTTKEFAARMKHAREAYAELFETTQTGARVPARSWPRLGRTSVA